MELAQISNGARILDIATGRGAVLFPAAEAVGEQGHVTGIDLSKEMVEETRREIQGRNLKNVDLKIMDSEHLEFPDGSFDLVFCSFAIFFFPQLERALSEMMRVLKPGGRIAVSTWGRSIKEPNGSGIWSSPIFLKINRDLTRNPKRDRSSIRPKDSRPFSPPPGLQQLRSCLNRRNLLIRTKMNFGLCFGHMEQGETWKRSKENWATMDSSASRPKPPST
ncbi:MAG: class I SAM-dependent methyltransferase [Syntrophothermus sp.]